MLRPSDPAGAKVLLDLAQQSVEQRWRQYKKLAEPLQNRERAATGNSE
jgi:hypothetical protein